MLSTAVVFDGLQDHQRPTNSPDLTETLYEAEGNGWTAKTLKEQLRQRIPTSAGTGAVIWHLRQIAATQPTNTPKQTRKDDRLNHQPCLDHDGCQLCWCEACPPNCTQPHQHTHTPTHHRPVPMPDNTRKQIWSAIASTRIPN